MCRLSSMCNKSCLHNTQNVVEKAWECIFGLTYNYKLLPAASKIPLSPSIKINSKQFSLWVEKVKVFVSLNMPHLGTHGILENNSMFVAGLITFLHSHSPRLTVNRLVSFRELEADIQKQNFTLVCTLPYVNQMTLKGM